MQEEKQLLLTDISARIPYRLKFFVDNTIPPLPSSEDYKRGEVFSVLTATGLDIWEGCIFAEETGMDCVLFAKRNGEEIQVLKPYLHPMSSMTEEEFAEYEKANDLDTIDSSETLKENLKAKTRVRISKWYHGTDWLNAHHFDYRGLIEKNLALEAPKDMYKFD